MQASKKRRAGWLPTILITALCCVIAFLLARVLVPVRTRHLTGATQLPVYAGQQCEALGDGVIYYDGTMLYALNGAGGQRWSYLAGANAGFKVGDNGVCTWTGSLITLLGEKDGATTFSVTMPDNVLDAFVGTQYTAVITGTETTASTIILDRNGKQVDSISQKNRTILDFGFFNNGNLYWCLTLDTDSTMAVSNLDIFKPGKMQTGSISESDQIVYKAMFGSTTLEAVGTTYMRVYDYTGSENSKERKLVYGWYLQSMHGSGDNALMVFIPSSDSESSGLQDLRVIQGTKDVTLRLPYEAFAVWAGNGTVYGFTENYLMTCSAYNVQATIWELPITITKVLDITDDNKALVVSDGRVWMVQLP